MDYHKQGFTIVELLVVIVVIAILASIAVVSYQGITIRAENVRIISAASQWREILNIYAATYGPTLEHSDSTPSCLGSTTDYPATEQFTAGICVGNAGETWGHVSDEVNDKLKSAGSISQTWKKSSLDNFQGYPARGIMYARIALGNVIVYNLQGNNLDCGLDGAVKEPEEYEPQYMADPNVTTCLLPVDLKIE